MNCTNGVIFVCVGPTEKCHHTIAEIAGDFASIAPDGRAALPPICINELVQILRVQLFGKLRRAHQVAEHHRDLTEFGVAVLRRGGCFRAGSCNLRCVARLPRPPNFVDGPEQFLAVAQGDSEFFKVVFGQIREDGVINMVFRERLGVLA